ncbi:MAG: hypothetical protein F6J96_35175 [Symploca sp. SIO1C2]|nr:hypothetical protein [Symploca sp. SIO1C2]
MSKKPLNYSDSNEKLDFQIVQASKGLKNLSLRNNIFSNSFVFSLIIFTLILLIFQTLTINSLKHTVINLEKTMINLEKTMSNLEKTMSNFDKN